MWYGTNGDAWKLYENGKLVHEVKLVNNSPNAQHAEVKLTNKSNGTYTYTAELINTAGVTKSKNTIVHEVTKNDAPIDVPLPESASGYPAVGYTVLNEDDTNLNGQCLFQILIKIIYGKVVVFLYGVCLLKLIMK